MIIKKTLTTFFTLIFLSVVNEAVFSQEGSDQLIEIKSESAQINCGGFSVIVDCVITDPNGKKLGYDQWTKRYYHEAEGGYGLSAGGECGPEEKKEECKDLPPSWEAMLNITDGIYIVETKAADLTKFYISIRIHNITKKLFGGYEFDGVLDKGYASKFQFTYNSADTSKWSAARVATISSLKQDIMLSRKVNWIDNDGIMTSLLKKVEAIEASIGRGNISAAKGQLNAFINEVVAQKGKHIDEDAVTMLTEDAYYIRNNL